MADKSSFTPDEWKVVLSSPMLAGLAVTLAEPSGLWGMLKESARLAHRSHGPKRQRARKGRRCRGRALNVA